MNKRRGSANQEMDLLTHQAEGVERYKGVKIDIGLGTRYFSLEGVTLP